MRASTSGVLLVVVVTGWSFGQQPPDKPPAEKGDAGKRPLEEMLASALRHSPDVQVAEAKVREAEAELRRTRLTLLQKIIEAHGTVEVQRAAATQAEATFRRISRMAQAGQASAEEMEKAQAILAATKAQLAQAEATLNGLTGTIPGGLGALTMPGGEGGLSAGVMPGVMPQPSPMMGGNVGFGGGGGMFGMPGGPPAVTDLAGRAPRGPMADKLRAVLDAPVRMSPVKDKSLADALAPFRAAAKGVPVMLHLGDKANIPVSLPLDGEVPLGAAFQALQDLVPVTCYVRDYGILITFPSSEGGVDVDGMPLVEFWRMTQGATKPVGR
jgi:hypothetical protein